MSETAKVLRQFVLHATPEWGAVEKYVRDAYLAWFGQEPLDVDVSQFPHEVNISVVVPEQTEEQECWDFKEALRQRLEEGMGLDVFIAIEWPHKDEETGRNTTRPWRYPPRTARPELVKDESE